MKVSDAESMIEELHARVGLEREWLSRLELELQSVTDAGGIGPEDPLPDEIQSTFRNAADENLIGEDHFPEVFARIKPWLGSRPGGGNNGPVLYVKHLGRLFRVLALLPATPAGRAEANRMMLAESNLSFLAEDPSFYYLASKNDHGRRWT